MSKNQTERSLEDKAKKPRYLYHFPLIVGGCIATSMIISAINPDSSAWGIIFFDLVVLTVVLLFLSFIRKAIVPTILSYIIILMIPIFYIMNYRNVLDIPYSDGSDLETLEGKFAFSIARSLCKKEEYERLKSKLKFKTIEDWLFYFDLPIYTKRSCGNLRGKAHFVLLKYDKVLKQDKKLSSFFSGSRFTYKKYKNKLENKQIRVKYKESKIYSDNNVFYNLLSRRSFKMKMVYGIEADDYSIPLEYFNTEYRNKKIRYFLFAILFFINSICSLLFINKAYKYYVNQTI